MCRCQDMSRQRIRSVEKLQAAPTTGKEWPQDDKMWKMQRRSMAVKSKQGGGTHICLVRIRVLHSSGSAPLKSFPWRTLRV